MVASYRFFVAGTKVTENARMVSGGNKLGDGRE